MPERPASLLDYSEFADPPHRLFRDYLTRGPALAPFFDGVGWDLTTILSAAERAARRPRERGGLAQALIRQQEKRGAARAAERAGRLAADGSVAVVTGQQPVVFGGPLLVLYKALAVLEVAARIEAERKQPAIPVFWVASDDHDFEEMSVVSVLDGEGRICEHRYAPSPAPALLPASRIVLDASIDALVTALDGSVRQLAYAPAVLRRIASSYRPKATLAGAFASFLSSLLPELVVLDPSEPEIKALMRPVFRRELLEGSPVSRLAAEDGRALVAAGYHEQVPLRPGFLNLFVLVGDERRALALMDGDVEIRGLGRRLPLSEAADWLDAFPEQWSPSVLLRPLAQDHLLPTAAYVGGPAEIAYHAQLGSSYRYFDLPRPVLFPRPGVTIVEASAGRALENEGVTLAQLQGGIEPILARVARQSDPAVDDAFQRAREAVIREMNAVKQAVGAVDLTLGGAAESALGKVLHPIAQLEEKALRALKKREQLRIDRLRRVRAALFPNGHFQERDLGFVGFLARHGEGLIETLRARIDPWATSHQVVSL